MNGRVPVLPLLLPDQASVVPHQAAPPLQHTQPSLTLSFPLPGFCDNVSVGLGDGLPPQVCSVVLQGDQHLVIAGVDLPWYDALEGQVPYNQAVLQKL